MAGPPRLGFGWGSIAIAVGVGWISNSYFTGRPPVNDEPRPRETVQRVIEHTPFTSPPNKAAKELAPPATSPLQGKPPPETAPIVFLFSKDRTRVRSMPSTGASTVTVLEKGVVVKAMESANGWWRVETIAGDSGWIRGDLLSPDKPKQAQSAPTSPAPAPAIPLKNTAKTAIPKPKTLGVKPIRDPYIGTCDCPYDLKRNGARCGGSSAFSRPGGRAPRCYE